MLPDAKPEHMTALVGDVLVEKDHPMIALRGQLDSLEAQVVAAQLVFQRLCLPDGIADLEDVLQCLKQVMRATVLGVPIEPPTLLGLTAGQLREVSHHPARTFGLPHFFTTLDDGEAVITLNLLRTKAREVELAAYAALKYQDQEQAGVMMTLNRLSSALYIMMFKAKAGQYSR